MAGDHPPQGPTGSDTQASAFSDSAEVFYGPSWSPESSGETPDRGEESRDAIKRCIEAKVDLLKGNFFSISL